MIPALGQTAYQSVWGSAEYGISILDKSRYSNKQVATFRYNEKGRARLLELLWERGKP
ncbi:hypothetical protein MTBGP_09600 [Moorella thermoacetica]